MACSPLKFSLLFFPVTHFSLSFYIFSESQEMPKVLNVLNFAEESQIILVLTMVVSPSPMPLPFTSTTLTVMY